MSAQIVSFKCTLKNRIGQVISTTINRDVITSLEASSDTILTGLVQGLQNLTTGEKRRIDVAAENAYGFYDPKKVFLFPRRKIDNKKHISCGEQVAIVDKDGVVRRYRVVEVRSDVIALDGNHPLAGQDLIFEIETLDAREATAEEILESNPLNTKESLH